MAEKVSHELSETLIRFLQGGQAVVFGTTDGEGWPNLTIVSWLVARGPTEVRLAIDPKSRSVDNIRRHGQCVLQLFTGGTAYLVRGDAELLADRIEGVKFPMGVVRIAVKDVRENMFFGGRLQHELTYDYTYKLELAQEIDRAVYAALRG